MSTSWVHKFMSVCSTPSTQTLKQITTSIKLSCVCLYVCKSRVCPRVRLTNLWTMFSARHSITVSYNTQNSLHSATHHIKNTESNRKGAKSNMRVYLLTQHKNRNVTQWAAHQPPASISASKTSTLSISAALCNAVFPFRRSASNRALEKLRSPASSRRRPTTSLFST